MKDQNFVATPNTQIRVTKCSPDYWRVTFDHPPLNIFGPEMLPQVNEIITALETDEQVKVVVFDSAVEGFFLIHLDFLVGGGENGYQFGGRDGARCGVTLWRAVGAGREQERLLSPLRPDRPRFWPEGCGKSCL
jgi:enoyl-CoA hydratase/carnithine racemase